jgi:hypothetical protein
MNQENNAMRKPEWATVLASFVASCLLLGGGWLIAAGELRSTVGATTDRVKAIEDRQTRVETLVLERLDKTQLLIMELSKQLAEHEGESRAVRGNR